MTTTEPLQFSVISAPVAAIDRRALSQAWYSALYRHDARARAARTAQSTNASPPTLPKAGQASGQTRVIARAASQTRSGRMTVAETHVPVEPERRQARCALARRIERTLLRANTAPKSATFRISGVPGRVHVMVREGARGPQLIAVCSRGARAHVAAALQQARYALAARGIALDAQLRCEENG